MDKNLQTNIIIYSWDEQQVAALQDLVSETPVSLLNPCASHH